MIWHFYLASAMTHYPKETVFKAKRAKRIAVIEIGVEDFQPRIGDGDFSLASTSTTLIVRWDAKEWNPFCGFLQEKNAARERTAFLTSLCEKTFVLQSALKTWVFKVNNANGREKDLHFRILYSYIIL